jgi:uncharacterized membrane protein
MELNFGLGRLAILAACVGLFVLLGGFSMPELQESADAIRVGKAWRYCVAMYLAGAVCVSLIDHSVGNLDRTNLRFLYVLLGIALMAGGAWWLHTMKGAVTKAARFEERGTPPDDVAQIVEFRNVGVQPRRGGAAPDYPPRRH